MAKVIKVLVVDDEEVIRRICQRTLAKEGYEVDTAENGVKALGKLKKFDCDIALLDLKMPLMGGMELLEVLKRDYTHIEAIIMTGYATIENAIEAMKKGAFDFVLKPFKADQLRLVVNKCAKSILLDQENQELKLANQKLQELQEMKDKFVAITSHELRTPVSHIKGYLTLLSENGNYELGEDEKKEFFKVIHSAVEALEHIVVDMHNIAQMDSGGMKIQKESLDVNMLAKEVVEEFRLAFKERHQKLTFLKAEHGDWIEGDRLKIKQVISELIQNAIKYTPDGGEIKVSIKKEDDFCVITVADSGIGIDDSELGKIFEKFYEVQDTDYHSTSETGFMGGGMGIGLSIARTIIEAHGGRIKVESQLNQGSRFSVYLPLSGVKQEVEAHVNP